MEQSRQRLGAEISSKEYAEVIAICRSFFTCAKVRIEMRKKENAKADVFMMRVLVKCLLLCGSKGNQFKLQY